MNADDLPHQAGPIGWATTSVGTLCGCLHPHGALMATESLLRWVDTLTEKSRKELTLPVARTLRTIAQSDGFRHAVLADVSRSQVR